MTEQEIDPPATRRTVVVSHLLPIHFSRDEHGSWSARWDEEISTQGVAISRYTAIGVRRLSGPVLFVGSPHVYVPPDERPAVEAAIAAAGIDCALVHLSPSVASRFCACAALHPLSSLERSPQAAPLSRRPVIGVSPSVRRPRLLQSHPVACPA